MLGEVAVRLPAEDGGSSSLSSVLDALGGDALEVLVRDERAGVAQLTLQLRALRRDAPQPDDGRPSPAFDKARVLLASSLDESLDSRRRAMLAEEAAVRVEAARRIRAAHEEGAALVARANAGCLAVLVGGLRPPAGEAGPELRIVAEPVPAPAEGRPGPETPLPTEVPPRPDPPAPAAPSLPNDSAPPRESGAPVPSSCPPASAAAERPHAPARPSAAPPTHHRSRRGWKSYLYLDVILPLVAVLVVLAVLLAWVG